MQEITKDMAIANRREVYQAMIDRNCCDKCRAAGLIGLAVFEPFANAMETLVDKKLQHKGVVEGVGLVVGDLVAMVAPDQTPDDQLAFLMTLQSKWAQISHMNRPVARSN